MYTSYFFRQCLILYFCIGFKLAWVGKSFKVNSFPFIRVKVTLSFPNIAAETLDHLQRASKMWNVWVVCQTAMHPVGLKIKSKIFFKKKETITFSPPCIRKKCWSAAVVILYFIIIIANCLKTTLVHQYTTISGLITHKENTHPFYNLHTTINMCFCLNKYKCLWSLYSLVTVIVAITMQFLSSYHARMHSMTYCVWMQKKLDFAHIALRS